MKKISDKEVILRIKNGEIDYFEYIVKKYSQKIYQLIKSKLTLKEDAEDLTQNTFIKFYKAIDHLKEDLPIMPYLSQIAKNELKMFYRSKKKTISLDEKILLVDDRLITKLEKEEIDLRRLNHQEKKILLMLAEGFSYLEIAKKFKKPLNTIKSIIRRARIKLKVKSQKSKINEKA